MSLYRATGAPPPRWWWDVLTHSQTLEFSHSCTLAVHALYALGKLCCRLETAVRARWNVDSRCGSQRVGARDR
jgi:hypothetical protein